MCVAGVASREETYGRRSDKAVGSEQATEDSECHAEFLFVFSVARVTEDLGAVNLQDQICVLD